MNPLKYSSWNRLRRVTAWVRRFADLLLAKVKKQGKPVGVVARTYIDANWNRQRWRTVGETNTGGEISWRDKRFDWRKRSQKTEPLEISYPIVDELGILRVGGRLDRAELSYDAAHPMNLPKKHHIKQLIVADVHNRCRHAGVNHVLAQVRNRCWIIDGRQEVKNLDKECEVCERRRVQPSVQIMAPLQRRRVGTTMRAFAKCCVDYAGPFTTKITRRVSDKRYLCLFTCSATRAVHLEMACSLSTTDFLNTFSQMVATRGRPEEVKSDYGTDFVGAERESSENLFKQWTRNRSPVMLPITGSDGIGILRWGRFLVGCLSRCLK